MDVIEVVYRADAGETSLVLRMLRLASPVERCDRGRVGGDGDLSSSDYIRFLLVF